MPGRAGPAVRWLAEGAVRSSLWRHPAFLRLWIGQTAGLFGSSVAALALPLVAIVSLQAGPVEVGVLAAAQRLPWLVIGLLAGVWVDRVSRRRLMVAADAARAVVLLTLPVAAVLGALRLELLYAAGAALGALTVVFEIALLSYLPQLLDGDELAAGNSKLLASEALAEMVGPSAAGALVQLISAPASLLATVLSFAVSAGCVARIGERAAPAPGRREPVVAALVAGVRFVASARPLAALLVSSGVLGFFGGVQVAVYLVYLSRDLGLAPAPLGVALGLLGAGSLAGAAVAPAVQRRLGIGPAVIVGATVDGVAVLALAAAGGPPAATLVLAGAALALLGFGLSVYYVSQTTLRQSLAPLPVQGRVNALARVVGVGLLSLGALAGGALGEAIGLRAALAVAGAGVLLAPAWLLCTPVRRTARTRA